MTSLKARESVLSPRGSTDTPTRGPKSGVTPADGRVNEIRRLAMALAASAGALGSGVIVRTA
jgi:hypothetical protein